MAPRSVDVLWLVEHVARELDVACAVKHLAAQRYGLEVEIVSIRSDARAAARRFRPCLVTTPFFFGAKVNATRRFLAMWPEALFFNLTWEQIFYGAKKQYKELKDDFARRHVIHHVWGGFYREELLRQGVPEELVYVNGQPAYQLYDAPYNRYFPSRAAIAQQYGLDPDRRWVFFAENYNWAFFPERHLRHLIAHGADRATLYDLRRFCQQSFADVVGWFGQAVAHHDLELIVRPRPTTASTVMQAAVQAVLGAVPPHFHIIKDGSVREWILGSDVVVSSYSTSLIEAAIARKPSYMLKPYPFPASLQTEWHHYAPSIQSAEAFDAICAGQPTFAETQPLHDWARASLMAHGDAISNLADLLWTFTRPDFARPPRAAPDMYPQPLPWIVPWSPVLTVVRTTRRLAKQWRARLRTEMADDAAEADKLTAEEIDRRVARWARTLADAAVPVAAPV